MSHGLLKQMTISLATAMVCWTTGIAGTTDLVAEGVNWPRFGGPNNSGSANQTDIDLIDDLRNAGLIWESEPVPDGRAPDGSNDVQSSVSGGFASPVVADNKVYLFYYQPSGTVYSKQQVEKTYQYTNGVTKDKWLISADDVVICFDAQSGETLWKTVFIEKGLNWQGFNKAGPGLTTCVSNGKVYAVGTTGRMYCLDAATGDSHWESHIGYRHEMMEGIKQQWLDKEEMGYFNRDMGGSPVVIGNAVVMNTSTLAKGDFPPYEDRPNGLIARNAETGDSIWFVESCIGLGETPLEWSKDGRSYVLSAGDGYLSVDRQSVFCFDSETGEKVWEIATGPKNGNGLVVDGDHLICQGDSPDGVRTMCYLLNTENPQLLWSIPERYDAPPALDHNGHVYLHLDDGRLACVRLSDGMILSFNYTQKPAFMVWSNGVLFMDTDQSHGGGQTYLYSGTPLKIARLGYFRIFPFAGGYYPRIFPALVDGRLFVRHDDAMACYDFRSSSAETRNSESAISRLQSALPQLRTPFSNRGGKPGDARLDLRGRRLVQPNTTAGHSQADLIEVHVGKINE